MYKAVLRQLTAPVKIVDAITQASCINMGRLNTEPSSAIKASRTCKEEPIHPSKHQKVETQTISDRVLPCWAMQALTRFQGFLLSNFDIATTVVQKAAKNDDAEVPEHLWNYCIANLLKSPGLTAVQQQAADCLRKSMLTNGSGTF
ncbi:hypothetical protein ACA910_020931 [Epithemia clementina (nom. ined.)]